MPLSKEKMPLSKEKMPPSQEKMHLSKEKMKKITPNITKVKTSTPQDSEKSKTFSGWFSSAHFIYECSLLEHLITFYIITLIWKSLHH